MQKHSHISDEQLVAFSDGQCETQEQHLINNALVTDKNLQARLSRISMVNSHQLKNAFGLELTHAPVDRLESFLDEAVDQVPTGTAKEPPSRFIMAVLLLLAVLAGALGRDAGRLIVPVEINNWRESVAVYQMLYTQETLANVTSKDSDRELMRKRLSRLSGLDIKLFDLNKYGLNFKRGQILDFKGSKLVQLAYLSTSGKPVAICFLNKKQSDAKNTAETRHGLNVVHWVRNGIPVMIIGDLPSSELKKLSLEIAAI